MHDELHHIIAKYQDPSLHLQLGLDAAQSKMLQQSLGSAQVGPLPPKPTGGLELMGGLEIKP